MSSEAFARWKSKFELDNTTRTLDDNETIEMENELAGSKERQLVMEIFQRQCASAISKKLGTIDHHSASFDW